ncbi:hypothetical protein GQ43DRAFT_461050 [Delitschia confertaspora ATCC 74209]|uniref:Zn(2)-C6 fungal-type domain-containing protein n=1 Tax=Delitschia confertaspora ATCC 74209 TaxID=1513339 RepID=A0A9P4MUW3_9PLEO|nr:hypothetical protein GQ43DRAFT_461050 [Delitschia confertaspora ATCC 74209]
MTMTDITSQTVRIPRQPKLRSSCDECGAAKLKCDRGQPECGRCISLGLLCVYGVSRKMGKPSRRRLQIPGTPAGGVPVIPTGNVGSQQDREEINGRRPIDGFSNNFRTSIDSIDSLHSDLFGSVLPDYFPSLEFGDGSNIDLGHTSTLSSTDFEGYATPTTQTDHSHNQVNEKNYFESALLALSGSNKGHDCFREAHETLGSLSFDSLHNVHSLPQTPPASASTMTSNAQGVPLDHVLRLNREASERLGRLLTCSCAASPHIALLHASIICRILIWYEQGVSSTQSTASVVLDTTSLQLPLTEFSPCSGSGSSGGGSAWSSAAASTFNTGGETTPILTGLSVAPARMALGSFNIDDLRVQAALKIQLLLGEMRRVSRLIDQFTSHNTGASNSNGSTFGGVEGLYQNLDTWLRGEHSRIANTMRSELRAEIQTEQ